MEYKILIMRDQQNKFDKCDFCGKVSEDVKYRINPYIDEICHEEVWEYLCDQCYYECLMDI